MSNPSVYASQEEMEVEEAVKEEKEGRSAILVFCGVIGLL